MASKLWVAVVMVASLAAGYLGMALYTGLLHVRNDHALLHAIQQVIMQSQQAQQQAQPSQVAPGPVPEVRPDAER